MINAVILEKESTLNDLTHLFHEFCPEVMLCGEFTSASIAMQKLPSLHFDLLLLGLPLELNEAASLMQLYSAKRFQMMATYASNLHVLELLQSSVSEFLTLPLSGKKLRVAVSNVLQQIIADNLFHQIDSSYSFCKSDNLVINTQQQYLFIPVTQILYCKATSSYTEIYYKEESGKSTVNGIGKSSLCVTASRPLLHFEQVLLRKGFIRIHNAYLVNKKQIRVIDRRSDKVILDDGTALPLSRTRKEALLKEMI